MWRLSHANLREEFRGLEEVFSNSILIGIAALSHALGQLIWQNGVRRVRIAGLEGEVLVASLPNPC